MVSSRGSRARLLTLVTGVHALVTLACIVYSMAAASARFEDPASREWLGARVVDRLADVLTLPLLPLWTAWGNKSLPNGAQWVLFLGNSLLWGAVVVTVAGRWRRRRDKR